MIEQTNKFQIKIAELENELATRAREAEIEAALERVRNRTMAMQKSEELREVIQLIFDELYNLGFALDSASFAVEFNETNDLRIWSATPGQQYANRVDLPYIDHTIFNTFIKAKETGERFITIKLNKAEKNKFFDHYFKYTPNLPQERKDFIYNGDGWVQACVLMKTVALNIQNYSGIIYSEEQNKTLMRFGKVFEQTYTRFLDLQKAEALAREAQIETALERVRSRSIAMQKSDELREVIQLIFDQFYALHFNIDSASFAVELNETNDLRIWVATLNQQYANRIDLPYLDHPIFNTFIKAKETGENLVTLTLKKEEKNKFFDHYFKYVTPVAEERKNLILNSDAWSQSSVLMKMVALNIQNYAGFVYPEEQNKTLMRFGKVFEQTYTRFLDLQKAEANARESMRQASIDRVRAEIASMRTAKDLEKITPLVWNELLILGIPFIRCGVFIISEEKGQAHVYLSTPDGKAIAAFNLPFHNTGFVDGILASWRKNEMFIDHWNAEKFSSWTHDLVQAHVIQADERYSSEKPPENLYLHFIPFAQGMLYVGNTAQLSEDALKLVQSLADAFSGAYARYDDFNKLEIAKQQIEITLSELKSAQAQLIQSEKMASLGELTAGIAHEIQNPLNFVNNFSEVNKELLEELKAARLKPAAERDDETEAALLNDIEINEDRINHHGRRADAIVKNMLQHSRVGKKQKELVDINALCDEYLRLSYHGLRVKDKAFNAEMKTEFDKHIEKINVIPQDIGRLLINLLNNAFYTTNEKQKVKAAKHEDYRPLVTISTKKINGAVEIYITDNGNGIPSYIIDKIFQPFFTTKPAGMGTGLGLSLSYDIIKAHNGEIKVQSKEKEGSEFTVLLPVSNQ